MGGCNSRAKPVQLGQAADEDKSDESHFYHFCHLTPLARHPEE